MKRWVLRVAAAALCLAAASTAHLNARGRQEAAPGPLRVGIVSAIDALPLMVARDFGYFEAEGVRVDLTLLSPAARNAAIQAGQLDGAISDLLDAALHVAAGFDFRVTSMTNGRFAVVASPQSGIRDMAGLRGARVGLFPNTMTQFVAEALLEDAGVGADEYEPTPVPDIQLRLEMILNGQLDAGVLPEPLLTAAVSRGAVLLAQTGGGGLEAGALFFSLEAREGRPAELAAFNRAYWRAAQSINADPETFRDYLFSQPGFPAEARDDFVFPLFDAPALPTDAQSRRALDWMRARGILTAPLEPGDLTDGRALAQWSN
jgi:NitT/TauT family transport system substrate-binding protein